MNTLLNIRKWRLLAEEILVILNFIYTVYSFINPGSATLVRNVTNNQIYVAKKVLLGGLSQKEVEGAHLEVNDVFNLT